MTLQERLGEFDEGRVLSAVDRTTVLLAVGSLEWKEARISELEAQLDALTAERDQARVALVQQADLPRALEAELATALQQCASGDALLTDVAYQVIRNGGIGNHGHRTPTTACAECQLVNRLEAYVVGTVDAALANAAKGDTDG